MNAVNGRQACDANDHIRASASPALCHSTVDNSVMPGIGRRLDGWPNRDLNPGAIVALSPVLPADKKAVYQSWGRASTSRYNHDGKSAARHAAGVRSGADQGKRNLPPKADLMLEHVAVTRWAARTTSDPRLGIGVKHTPT
jgi:hypothetical protein